MRVIQFRASGISQRQRQEERQTDQSSRFRSNDRGIAAPATSTILVSTLVVVLVIRSTGSYNGFVLEAMRQTGIDMPQARLAVDLAQTTNAKGEVVLNEALDKAQAIKAAAATDPPEAYAVRGIHCRADDNTITAEIRPARPDITIQVTVSSADGFYSSDSRRTDSAGKVSFEWPSGEPASRRATLSVASVVSGLTAASPVVWSRGPTQPWDFDNSSK